MRNAGHSHRIARSATEDRGMLTDIAGFAIWASVSEEVDAKAARQIKAGIFPVRLKPKDWQSGSVNWLLDGEARAATGSRRAERPGPEDGRPGDRQLRPGGEDGRAAVAPADRRAGGEGAAGEDGRVTRVDRTVVVTTVGAGSNLSTLNGLHVGVRTLLSIDAGD